MPRVYNKRTDKIPANAVYVGRPSPFGNPFYMKNEDQRDAVVNAFEKYVLARPVLVARIKNELHGKDLVCWCSPRRCHADVLLKIANS